MKETQPHLYQKRYNQDDHNPAHNPIHFLDNLEFTFTDGTVVVYNAQVLRGYETKITLLQAYNEHSQEDIPLLELTGTQYAMLKEAAEGKVSE